MAFVRHCTLCEPRTALYVQSAIIKPKGKTATKCNTNTHFKARESSGWDFSSASVCGGKYAQIASLIIHRLLSLHTRRSQSGGGSDVNAGEGTLLLLGTLLFPWSTRNKIWGLWNPHNHPDPHHGCLRASSQVNLALGFFSSKCRMKSLAGKGGKADRNGYFLFLARPDPNRTWGMLLDEHHRGQPWGEGVCVTAPGEAQAGYWGKFLH